MPVECWEHDGAVTGGYANVQYTYSEMPSGANHSRLTSMIYASGYTLNYNYASGLDASISRLSSMSDSGNTLESLSYLGLGTVVKRAHPENGVDLTYIKKSGESDGDAGDKYIGLDRFGRVVDQRWLNSGGTDVDRYQYGYDRDGNRLWKYNIVNTALSELYTYDGLNQIAMYGQGTLNGGKTSLTTTVGSQSWDYDSAGNWDSVTTGGTTQTRGANKQNEITSVSSATTPTYDANGNTTKDENNFRYVFDAWNKLVTVKNSSNAVIAAYENDALFRRIEETVSGTTTDRFFSAAWQLLEEKVGSNTLNRYVWSPVYVDALVSRDRDTDANGTLDQRVYAAQDANFNVTALVNTSGSVVERNTYTPFGVATVRDASWTAGSTAYDWKFLHQGGEQGAAGLYLFRNRVYSATLGRWVQNDPIGFSGGDQNIYAYSYSNPASLLDPSGLKIIAVPSIGPADIANLLTSNLTCDSIKDRFSTILPYLGSNNFRLRELAREVLEKAIGSVFLGNAGLALKCCMLKYLEDAKSLANGSAEIQEKLRSIFNRYKTDYKSICDERATHCLLAGGAGGSAQLIPIFPPPAPVLGPPNVVPNPFNPNGPPIVIGPVPPIFNPPPVIPPGGLLPGGGNAPPQFKLPPGFNPLGPIFPPGGLNPLPQQAPPSGPLAPPGTMTDV